MLEEMDIPYLVVDPLNLQKVACHQLIQTIFICDHFKFLVYSSLNFSIVKRCELWVIAEVGLNFHQIDDPVKCLLIAVHSYLDSFSLADALDHLRKVRYWLFVLDPFSLEMHCFLGVILVLRFQDYFDILVVEVGSLVASWGLWRET